MLLDSSSSVTLDSCTIRNSSTAQVMQHQFDAKCVQEKAGVCRMEAP